MSNVIASLLLSKGFIHEFTVYDKNGNVVRRGRFYSNSWNKNFTKLQRVLLCNTTEELVATDGSTTHSITRDYLDDIDVKAPEGDSRYGIVLGEGWSSPTINSYFVTVPISHKDTKLYYYDTSVDTRLNVADTNKRYFTIYRHFENRNTSSIYVREVALAVLIPVDGLFFTGLAYDSKQSWVLRGIDVEDVEIKPGETIKWSVMPLIET